MPWINNPVPCHLGYEPSELGNSVVAATLPPGDFSTTQPCARVPSVSSAVDTRNDVQQPALSPLVTPLRDKDSNLNFRVQSPASLPLDHLGVRSTGIEPAPFGFGGRCSSVELRAVGTGWRNRTPACRFGGGQASTTSNPYSVPHRIRTCIYGLGNRCSVR